MKLTNAEIAFVLSRTPAKCPLCTSERRAVAEYLFALIQTDRNCKLGAAAIRPVAVVTCESCGHEMHFNAVHLGLLSPDLKLEPKSTPPEAGAGDGDRLILSVSVGSVEIKLDDDP